MRQIVQHLRSGYTVLEEVPAPVIERGHVLIATSRSLVSVGTEKMLVKFGRASLFQKAYSQPAKVKQVLGKIRSEGFMTTIEAVYRKLDEPLPLGYCSSGVVIDVGEGVTGFVAGDRVASNGPHAEVVSVPHNLVATVPSNVSDDAAAFTVVAAIGLQGIRLAKPELGEAFVVVGLGLIGQITAQLLQAHGCRVIGFDFDPTKVELAKKFGIMASAIGGEVDVVNQVLALTGGSGCDGVVITASTQSHDVIAQSAQMSRKRGRIVLVGVVGLNLNRADFYDKELTFQVSCSYGPGRYETTYEEKGFDYPLGYVRWTENRNFKAVLDAMSRGLLQVEELITQRVPLANFGEIYDNMDRGGLASLLVYTAPAAQPCNLGSVTHTSAGTAHERNPLEQLTSAAQASTIRVTHREVGPGALAVVGAGNFTKMTAMPALVTAKAPVKFVVSSGGVTGTSLAKKYEVPFSTTDYPAVLFDPDVRGVIITTRHNLHAEQAVAALRAGKHVLVEKPLCLSLTELRAIEDVLQSLNAQRSTLNSSIPTLTVGYNRRFSPHVLQMRELLEASSGPASMIATVNAGAIPPNHWVHDPEIGGGRLLGEACHFIDLAIFLTRSLVVEVCAVAVGQASDCASILLSHANGSTSVVNYLANGSRELSKERVEVHVDGRSLLLDNFCELRGLGYRSFSRLKTKQDKGHSRQFAAFAKGVKSGDPSLIPWAEIANSTRAALAVPLAIAQRRWVRVDEISAAGSTS